MQPVAILFSEFYFYIVGFVQGIDKEKEFEYTEFSVESVLDRLPTARIISEDKRKYIVQAEVFGNGIDMWLKSQGEVIKVIYLNGTFRRYWK